MKIILLFIWMSCLGTICYGQTQIVFQPANEYYFSNDQLWSFSILNSGKSSYTGNLEITLFHNGSIKIITLDAYNIEILKGMNSISNMTKAAAINTYGNDPIAQSFANTGVLPSGNYALCVTISNVTSGKSINSCEEINIHQPSSITLTYPLNNEVINTNYPVLTWTRLMPLAIAGVSYKLEIWETGTGKLNFKPQGNLYETTLNTNSFEYSAGLPELITGKTYTWTVSAFIDGIYLTAAQIWNFSIGDGSTARVMDEEDDDSYRVLGNETQGADYHAKGILRVAYNNNANDSLMSYSISPLDYPDSTIADMPEIILSNGLNQINIDLSLVGTLEDEIYYVFKVFDGNGRTYYLKFQYEEI